MAHRSVGNPFRGWRTVVQLNLCGEVTYSVTVKVDTVDAGAIRENLAACLPSDTHSPASLGSF
jgi:hypothetical protein